ncbi:hypothetical protein MPER_07952 [Moniliophthora perniciosa FA553]|nr:hypothetical protein MPER_07952 [Moniliophthora perniciosa FA553]
MSQTFAAATGQELHVYHAKDMIGRGRKRRQLNNLAREAAWAVPTKKAGDLGGRVMYVPGMPVFCTENIATELGISNGSVGKLVSIAFEETDGRRYAVSAEVDFKGYRNSDPNADFPNRVTLIVTVNPSTSEDVTSEEACIFNQLKLES